MPATITFRGKEVEVPYMGAMHLTRIAASLKELLDNSGVASKAGLMALQAREYSTLVMVALSHIIDHLGTDLGLSRAEELFHGSLGLLIGCTAMEVATAPLDELVLLCNTIFAQEAETTAGKRLMAILVTFAQKPSSDTESEKQPESPTDTTSPTSPDQPEIGGGASIG